MNPKISIIIPVYNSERYLKRCIDSVINQTYRNIEVIIVNDGSTDRSGITCDNFARTDARIDVIHKKNAGVSAARNEGIALAKGDYIMFIDSDDYIDTCMIEKLVTLAVHYKADITMCGCLKERANGIQINKTSGGRIYHYNKVDAINKILDKDEFHGYACNKLFSTTIVNSVNIIRFDEEIHICEDLLFCCECFNIASKIVYDSNQYYHYVFHDNNTSSKFNAKKLTSLKAYDKIFNLLSNNSEISISHFKTSYIQLVISLIIQNMNEGGKDKVHQILVNQLYRFKISELSKISVIIACLITRINPKVTKIIMELRRRLN